ncbi:signal transduction histidine kinase [Nocardioides daedukensis]|uniref:histidine kinase n=1 Tax=Nocardioides daedukensis TaxID=634462 RepID=A0A7Y9UQ06_9ACTN|nr:sensor domain-containing protein [Nocardioides daedukensis]NYG58091.1 signal transduction histidine kinase [Nocardioides daedukensis]
MSDSTGLPTAPGPLRLTGYAALQVLLFLPGVLLLVLTLVGGLLTVATIGIPLLLAAMTGVRWIADRHRTLAAATLGHPVPSDRLPTEGMKLFRRLETWARDPMTWRELGWLLVSPILFLFSLLTCLLLVLLVTGAFWWYGTPHIMKLRASLDRAFLSTGHTERLEHRVEVLTESRAASVDHSATELRRIERDLHDGAQARLVALGMTLGMAEELFTTDPDTALRMIAEARDTTGAVLGDIRDVVRGIHPPVLADRGLTGAVEALALDMAVPVQVTTTLAARPPAPVESAAYFAIAECLANIGKHADADHGWVTLTWREGTLVAEIGDDGRGGADPDSGTGIRGVMRRLAAFDGTMRVSSPLRGPTIITLEIPCALSSPRTTPSSETA